jgi:N6-adenosine-specific RNA methylase IME4
MRSHQQKYDEHYRKRSRKPDEMFGVFEILQFHPAQKPPANVWRGSE